METLRASSVLDCKKAGKKSRELWLFRVPADLDIKSLDGVQLPLGTGEVEGSVEGQTCMLQVSSQEAAVNEASQVLPLIPNEEGELSVAKPFSRLVKMTKTVDTAANFVVPESETPPQPAKLNGRVIPSGTGRKGIPTERRPVPPRSSESKKEKKKKKEKEKEKEAAAPVEVKEDVKEEETKEEKKKRKKSAKSEKEDEKEDAEDVDAGEEKEKEKKKKKKKKKDDEEAEVQEEPKDADEEEKKSKRKSSDGAEEEEGKKAKKKKKKDKSE